jgi:hypothetical protein
MGRVSFKSELRSREVASMALDEAWSRRAHAACVVRDPLDSRQWWPAATNVREQVPAGLTAKRLAAEMLIPA